ncbi:MAG: serine acetyltransferase [Planctomycetota bacterium]|nr:serine acetyltransferase [Planctomycetota bacterium]
MSIYDQVVTNLVESIRSQPRISRSGKVVPPSDEQISKLIEYLRQLVFPGFIGPVLATDEQVELQVSQLVGEVGRLLISECEAAFRYWRSTGEAGDPHDLDADEESLCMAKAEQATNTFLKRIPEIRAKLALDVEAAYDGDPAARHYDEIILCYPSIRALTVFRLAHELHLLDVPVLPRMLCEAVHRETGIDIHPGATIGTSFFIDHGTGVVIGETVRIGDRCKVYQGVTLGARSFPKDEQGRLTKGLHRHPTLEDDVVVYAGATILGGDTIIGARTEVAGGVFVTSSVPPDHFVAAPKTKTRVISRGQ